MRKRWIGGVCAVLVIAAGVISLVATGSSESSYRDTVLGVAHDGLSAVRTADLLSTTEGQFPVTYRSRALDDASTGLTDALDELESTEKPGPTALRLYDDLAPLLRAGVASLGDADTAMQQSDEAKLAAARHTLQATGDGLADFIRSNR